jgi:hypothetical protein
MKGTPEPTPEENESQSEIITELVWEYLDSASGKRMRLMQKGSDLSLELLDQEANVTRTITSYVTLKHSRPRNWSIVGSWKWCRVWESGPEIDVSHDQTAGGKHPNEKMEDTDA